MSTYTHLAQEERYKIDTMKKAGLQQNDITVLLRCTPLTISHKSIYHSVYTNKTAGGACGGIRIARGCTGSVTVKTASTIAGPRAVSASSIDKPTWSLVTASEAGSVLGWCRRGVDRTEPRRAGLLLDPVCQAAPWPLPRPIATAPGAACGLFPIPSKKLPRITAGSSPHTAISPLTSMWPSIFYSPNLYESWKHGTNENANGLIRQYLLESRDISTLAGSEISKIENCLNHRPRKCPSFLTPHGVFPLHEPPRIFRRPEVV